MLRTTIPVVVPVVALVIEGREFVDVQVTFDSQPVVLGQWVSSDARVVLLGYRINVSAFCPGHCQFQWHHTDSGTNKHSSSHWSTRACNIHIQDESLYFLLPGTESARIDFQGTLSALMSSHAMPLTRLTP